MTQLLVSVRNAREAEAAIAGGANLIDIKEPNNGPLGRANDAVVADILHQVAGRRPVSMALGELTESPRLPPFDFPGWIKIGLQNALALPHWQASLAKYRSPHLVAVAYADWESIQAPSPEEVLAFAIRWRVSTLLMDTAMKGGTSLLDAFPYPELAKYRRRAKDAGIRLALAGSLTMPTIEKVSNLQPDIIGVRGAACVNGDRGATVDEDKVRRIAELCSSRSKEINSSLGGGRG